MNAQVKFPSPYELKAPKGAEGWRDLYPYYALFQEERKEGDGADGVGRSVSGRVRKGKRG